jgi:hypothetical protein
LKREVDRSIDNLSGRLDRLEATATAADEPDNFSDIEYWYGLTEEELENMSPMEKYIIRFNWNVKHLMKFYKEEAMHCHNLTSDEYERRTLEGDPTIYLPQPNKRFEPTSYIQRIASVLGLDCQTLQDKIARGEIKNKIATGVTSGFVDEDPNRVF